MYIHTYILRSCCLKCLFQLGLDTAQSIYKRGMVIVKIWWALYNIKRLYNSKSVKRTWTLMLVIRLSSIGLGEPLIFFFFGDFLFFFFFKFYFIFKLYIIVLVLPNRECGW